MYNKHGVFWPVVLILVGSLLLMVKLQVLPANIVSYWPVLLIVFGLMGLSNIDKSTSQSPSKRKTTRKKK